ncbi:MAG: radical SAM protein, partial [Clostridia bacterium]
PNTALILSTNMCAMYCRHCFRKRLVGQTEDEILTFTDRALDYIDAHKEIDNVLISGGDSLLNSNKIIGRYLERLSKNPHIKYIRFGSRVPVVFPQRIYKDSELIELFTRYGKNKKVYVVTQFNHANEFTKEALQAINTLLSAGVPILNQTVLLAGVNDTPDTLATLFNKLAESGISPYYLFQCRPVKGVQNYFSVPFVKSVEIVDAARAKLSGVAKRFRYCMSHIRGKMEIVGLTQNKHLLLKQHQAKDMSEINRLFTAQITDDSNWLPDDINCESL